MMMDRLSAVQLILAAAGGVALRLIFIHSSYQDSVASRVQVSTPVTSWKRAVEGVHLMKVSDGPYSGDTFHEPPLFLYAYKLLLENLQNYVSLVFVVADTLTGIFLTLTCAQQLERLIETERPALECRDEEEKQRLKIESDSIGSRSLAVGALHFLCPLSLLPCIGFSTAVFTNLFISLVAFTATNGNRLLSMFLVALLTCHSLYPIALILPAALLIHDSRKSSSESKLASILHSLIYFLIFTSALTYASYYLMGRDSKFVSGVYGFLLSVPDLTPNTGLFWYFFTEMFDHFRDFFLWVFQINTFLYVVPLALTLRNCSPFLFFINLILLSLFKPYPSVADLALYSALMPQWSHLFRYMKQGLVVACMFISCIVLAPILWHLWISMGTANSNFYFGVSLAYNTAQIFLITDLLFANTKRQFFLKHGAINDPSGKQQRLELAF